MDKKQTQGRTNREQIATEIMNYVNGGQQTLIERKYIKTQLKLPLNTKSALVYEQLKGLSASELTTLLEGVKKEAIKTEIQTSTDFRDDISDMMPDVPRGDIEESKSQKSVKSVNQSAQVRGLEESKSQKSQKSKTSTTSDKIVQKPIKATIKSQSGKKESLDEWVNRSQIDEYIFEQVANNPAMQKKVPAIANLKYNLMTGAINQYQYNQQVAENIKAAARENKSVRFVLDQCINDAIRPVQRPSVYGNLTVLDEDISDFRSMANSTNGLTAQFDKGQKLPHFVQSKQPDINEPVTNILEHIETLSQRSKKDSSVHKKLEQIKGKIQQAYAHAEEAKEEQTNLVSPVKNDTHNLGSSISGTNVNPKSETQIVSIEDVVQTSAFDKLVDQKIKEKQLTDKQTELLKHTLFDADELGAEFDNFSRIHDDISDSSSSSSKSLSQSDKQTLSQISQQLKNGDYGQSVILQHNGETISPLIVVKFLDRIVDQIKNIQGDIDLQKSLSDYKRQTEVYTSHVKKQETNQFKIKAGSAFALRACC